MNSKGKGYEHMQGSSSDENQDNISSDATYGQRRSSYTQSMKRHLTLSNLLIFVLLILVGVLLNVAISSTRNLEKQPDITQVSKGE